MGANLIMNTPINELFPKDKLFRGFPLQTAIRLVKN